MSNWPRNHADFSHPNWTARTGDRCRDLEILENRKQKCIQDLKLTCMAIVGLTAFIAGFWVLDFLFG